MLQNTTSTVLWQLQEIKKKQVNMLELLSYIDISHLISMNLSFLL